VSVRLPRERPFFPVHAAPVEVEVWVQVLVRVVLLRLQRGRETLACRHRRWWAVGQWRRRKRKLTKVGQGRCLAPFSPLGGAVRVSCRNISEWEPREAAALEAASYLLQEQGAFSLELAVVVWDGGAQDEENGHHQNFHRHCLDE